MTSKAALAVTSAGAMSEMLAAVAALTVTLCVSVKAPSLTVRVCEGAVKSVASPMKVWVPLSPALKVKFAGRVGVCVSLVVNCTVPV